MSVETCLKCGGFKNPPEDMSPTLWCDCPLWDIAPVVDELLDPSEDEDYCEGYSQDPFEGD
jgi:hypothetical protein